MVYIKVNNYKLIMARKKKLSFSDKAGRYLLFEHAFSSYIARKEAEKIYRRKIAPSQLELSHARDDPLFRRILRQGLTKRNKALVKKRFIGG